MKLITNKAVRNAGWLIGGKILNILLSFVIGLITARYLGPNNYGLINYATAYTTFFASFCTLGINSIIVKNFIDHPQETGTTIGTAIILRLISSVLSLCMIAGIVRIIDGNDLLTLSVVVLYCISLVFHVFDTFNYWFQAKLLSKCYAIATFIAYLVASIYRVILLVIGKSVQWFAIANTVDYCIVAILLWVFYKENQGPKLYFSLKKAKELLSTSCSYILSGLMVAIYGATDKVMLKQLLDEASVGYYSLAVSISMMWTFVLAAVIDSVKPIIMSYYSENYEKFKQMNVRLYAFVLYFSVFVSICIIIIAPWFIRFAYGCDYLPAIKPLRIVIWYVAFAYLGVARDIWIVCEQRQKKMIYIYVGSAILNIILNSILIPTLGTCGAAWATLITQVSTILLFPRLIKSFKPNFDLMINAIKLKGIFK